MKNFKDYISESADYLEEKYDENEYDQEGEMAKYQLYSIIKDSKNIIGMLEDNTNLPEWVQSKMTLAHDYISTVSDYLSGTMKEGFDHNSNDSLHAAILKHKNDLNKSVRDKKNTDVNYHRSMLAKAEAERRRRDTQDFEEKRAKAKK